MEYEDLSDVELERLQKAQQSKKAEKKKAVLKAYRRWFESDDGKLMVEDLSKAAHMFTPITVAGDPGTSSFNDGARMLFIRMLKLASVSDKERQVLIEQQTKETT